MNVTYNANHRFFLELINTNISTQTGLPTDISWDTVVYDTIGIFIPSNPTKIIIPDNFNLIRFNIKIAFAANATGTRKVECIQNSNPGNPVLSNIVAALTGSVTIVTFSTPWILCVKNDDFKITVTQTSGGNLNVGSGITTTYVAGDLAQF